MKNLVSVIVLSYRNIPGIYETLDSILNQTYENIELVISDDGTPGFSDEIAEVKAYIEKGNRGNISNTIVNSIIKNVGTVKNINSAIEKTSGKYIKIISAEDKFSDETALDKYIDFMESGSYLIAFAKMRGVTPDGKYKYKLLSCESDYKLLKSYTIQQTRNRLFRRNFLPAPACIIDRKLFDEAGLFLEDTRLIEDYPYWCYLAEKGIQFGYIEEVLIDYKLSGVSSGGTYGEVFMKDMLIVYDKHIFPYDRRFGVLQPIYNVIKRAGLNFYVMKAGWNRMTKLQKLWNYIKYCHFFVFVKLQNTLNNIENKKGKR